MKSSIGDILNHMKNYILDSVCKHFGTQKALAEALGVTKGMVSNVVNGRRPIPAHWCPIIESETAGAFVCEQLRPDIQWHVVRENGVVTRDRRK